MTKVFNKPSQTPKRKLLRKNLSKSEILLWQELKNEKLGFKFRRQYSFDRYVVDFYCPILKLAIEIDGGYHLSEEMPEYDAVRQKYIESYGIKFLRFTNTDIIQNLPEVVNKILKKCKNPSQ